ncbi:MAG: S41 family peptidase, partial [Roseimicrobium sp.]
AKHLILDLRMGGKGLFEEAAAVLQTFLPQGELMFKMKQLHSDDAELFISKSAPLWTGRVVVLIDGETGHAAEAVAAVLHGQGRTLLIGEKSRGATVRYSDVTLDDNTLLRYASAEMLLPDGTSRFKKGLEPTFTVVGSQKEKHLAFAGSRGKSHLPYVNDRVRPRFNERALVHDQHPELDDYVRRSKGQSLPGDEGQTRDMVTQRAIDFLLAGDFGSASKIDWQAKPNPAEGPVENIPKAVPATPSPAAPQP